MDSNNSLPDGLQDPSPLPPEDLVSNLLDLIRLEQLEVDLYRGPRTHEPWVRVFGGQVIAQALASACETVDKARLPHSLHTYFMRPGDPESPIVYQVFRDRDGFSFSFRRVVAIQRGKPILNLATSFHAEEEGLAHQFEMPDVPPPEDLENEMDFFNHFIDQIPEKKRRFLLRPRPIEFRFIDNELITRDKKPPHKSAWFRVVAPLPDNPSLQRCLLAYASDMSLLSVLLRPHGVHWVKDKMQEASLDHALWIHENPRMDDWLLYHQDSPWTGGSRGLARGLIFDRNGLLIASVAQEGLIRLLD